MKKLEDWRQIILVCPCHIDDVKKSEDIKELKAHIMKMVQGNRNVTFECPICNNSFDYEIKIKLFEFLNKYYEQHHTYEKFSKYVTRKNERIRLRFIKEIDTNTDTAIIIEAANLTQHPNYKL